MKKLGLILVSCCFAIILATSVQAVPLTPDTYNGIFFENAEVLIDVGGDPGVIEIGDQFWGILNAQNIKNSDKTGQIGPNTWFSGGGFGPPKEISGYFSMEVVAITYNAVGPGIDLIHYGPTLDPNGILAAGEVFRVFEDSVNNYDNSNRALGLATATDGTHVWTMGMGPTADSPGGGYFYTVAPSIIPAVGNIGTTYSGLNFIMPDSALWVGIDDPNETLFNFLVDIWFNSESFVIQNPLSANYNPLLFDIGSNDPAVLYPIPEPTSMLLLGTGLVGLAGASRRRRKAAKKA